MELIVLGSGTAEPHPHRSSSAYWLDTGGGSVLLDCSAPSVHRMVQEGLDWADLDAIWISHFHLDHCAGVAPYLFATKYSSATQHRRKPLTIFGSSGLRRLLDSFDGANNYRLFDQPFPVEVIEIEPGKVFEILAGIDAVAYSTPHTPESCAIHIREQDTTLVYTADTGFDETLATFARRVDLLLMECSFVKDKPVKKHLELSEAVRLIRKAEPSKTILTHLYSDWDDVDLDVELRKLSPGCEVVRAFDGLRLAIEKNQS